MKKRSVVALVAMLAVTMNVMTGCGNLADVNVSVTEDEVVEMDVSEAVEDEVEFVEDEVEDVGEAEAAEDETEAEEVEDVDEVEEVEVELEAEAAPVEKTETVKNPSETVTTKPAETAPVVTPEPETTPAPTPEPTVEPTQPPHVHEWKEHMAETHVWISNVVTVEDYETQRVCIGSIQRCNCGYEVFAAIGEDPIYEHVLAHLYAGEPEYFQEICQYEDQQVLVSTHTEDQGHWETSTYVDYYYCECGARK